MFLHRLIGDLVKKLLMKNDMEDLRNWGLWTMAKFPDENCSLRTKLDGDFLQAFVALHECGIFEVYHK